MAMPAEMITMLRGILFDLSSPYVYSDDDLGSLLVVGTQFTLIEMSLTDEFVIDITNQTITPDPTLTASRHDALIVLAPLKSACMLSQGIARQNTGKANRVKDAIFEVSFGNRAADAVSLIKEGYCKSYSDLMSQWKLNGIISIDGNIIMTPIKGYND